MSKAQSLVKKATIFEKLANYGRREDFLHSLADASSDQQAALKKAQELFNAAIAQAKRYGNTTDPELKAAFSALPTVSPNTDVDLSSAAEKFEFFSKKLYEQGKKENNNQKMTAANAISSAAKNINSQVDVMKGAWTMPAGETGDDPEDSPPLEQEVKPAPAKPAAPTRPQSIKSQINLINNLANGLQSKPGPAKAQALKQINNTVLALQNALKNNNLDSKLITDSLRTLYNDKLEYNDLASVPALDYGRGVPEDA